MATNILMPALSPTMTEGTLARWLKKEGDRIRAGDVIAEIETDKATMEVEAVEEGILGRILVGDGTQGVKVNDPIAVLVEEGEEVPAGAAPAPGPAQSASQAPAIAAVTQSGGEVAGAAEQPVAMPAPRPAAARGNGHAGAERVFASPLARRMAKQAGLDLGRLRGSGPGGRIVKADVEAALARGPAAAPPAAA
uniref:biotin/lipoyl-containing protein n=1 Tax=Crenalkalicoccus roseus TaxID=1485588 RepID=UPI00107FD66A